MKMKNGFAIAGLIVGIVALVAGAAAVVFSCVGLGETKRQEF